jgi:hypothetical protein
VNSKSAYDTGVAQCGLPDIRFHGRSNLSLIYVFSYFRKLNHGDTSIISSNGDTFTIIFLSCAVLEI